MEETARTYRQRFTLCLVMWLPIMVMMYVVPYTVPECMTGLTILNGITFYILLFAIGATVI